MCGLDVKGWAWFQTARSTLDTEIANIVAEQHLQAVLTSRVAPRQTGPIPDYR